jgi:hypothetical protein
MDPQVQVWQWLVGKWATESTYPGLPDTVVNGETISEWLEDQQFLLQRSHFDHPQIPDAITVTGIIDGSPAMNYFDLRGIHRTFNVDITANTWRFSNNAPGFSQRFTGTLSEDHTTINGLGERSDDGTTWQPDLTITYRKTT